LQATPPRQVFPDGGSFAASDAAADQRALEPAVAWADALSDRSAHATAHATGAPAAAPLTLERLPSAPCPLPRRSFGNADSVQPSLSPTLAPSASPSFYPSFRPTSGAPSAAPTDSPTVASGSPTVAPTTAAPTLPVRATPVLLRARQWIRSSQVLSSLCAEGFNCDGGTPGSFAERFTGSPKSPGYPTAQQSCVVLCRAADGASYARPDARPDRISDALADGPADGPAVRKAQKKIIANNGHRDCRRARVPFRSSHVN
jgi:hypothetical protein